MSVQTDSEWEEYDPDAFENAGAAPPVDSSPQQQSESDFDLGKVSEFY